MDKQGRRELIDQFHELQQVLKRIILVSHQQEFVSAFSNRYHIAIEDGTSRVSLLDSATTLA